MKRKKKMHSLKQYLALADSGISATEFCQRLQAEEVTKFDIFILLRDGFGLSLRECMAVWEESSTNETKPMERLKCKLDRRDVRDALLSPMNYVACVWAPWVAVIAAPIYVYQYWHTLSKTFVLVVGGLVIAIVVHAVVSAIQRRKAISDYLSALPKQEISLSITSKSIVWHLSLEDAEIKWEEVIYVSRSGRVWIVHLAEQRAKTPEFPQNTTWLIVPRKLFDEKGESLFDLWRAAQK